MARTAKSSTGKAAKRRLKVYKAALGFYDTVVAAPNQGEALKAWGVRQNLFAEGAASVADEPATVKAALAHPGAPLRRAIGSQDPFGLDPTPPAAPTSPRRKPTRRRQPDRSALLKAEEALNAASAAREAEVADFARRREALEAEARHAEARWRKREAALGQAVEKARRAFARAGGD